MSEFNDNHNQTSPEKVDLQSMDISEEKRAQLKQIFPEIFHEDKIDFNQLKRVLGDDIDVGNERFGLHWAGKADCLKIIQQSSIATLKPVRDDSVNFDETENLFIEGDNLEVLKLLQKSYFNKVKMIYIDPPYNTGKEFIYPDKYSETLETYLEYSGQIDDKGRKFSTNTEREGRFHSNWLNMMYPRLYLARNLLRDDGVIFISIDDNEQANLKALCDHIFGEENFIGNITWESKTKSQNTDEAYRKLQPKTEMLLAYFKFNKIDFNLISRGQKEYSEKDEKGIFRYFLLEPMSATGIRGRESMIFNIKGISPPEGKQWQIGKEKVDTFDKRGDIVIENNKPYIKMRPTDERTNITEPFWGFFSKDIGTAESAKKELSFLLPKHSFETVKPVELIRRLIFHTCLNNDIILDFFAGSATTADAVMQLNAEDGGTRKYILVQLPEPCDEKTEAFKAGYKNIAEIARERIRRAGKKIIADNNGKLDLNNNGTLDIGFKSFKLTPSNFRIWQGDTENMQNPDDEIAKQLEMHINHINENSTPEDILYELLLNAGYELTTPIETLTLADKEIFAFEADEIKTFICLDKDLTATLFDEIAQQNPNQVICLDEGFNNNDQLKTNAVQTFKSRARQIEQEIIFRTV